MIKNTAVLIIIVLAASLAMADLVTLDSAAIYSGGKLGFGNAVSVIGNVASQDDVSLGNSTSITGSIYGNDKMWIGRSSVISGDIVASGKFSKGSHVRVGGSVTSGKFEFTGMLDNWKDQLKSITTGNNNINGSKYGVFDLAGGSYGKWNFNKNTTLNLKAGNYSLKDFWMNKGSIVNIDTTAGDVTLNVVGDFDTGKNVSFITTGSGKFNINVYKNNVWLGNDTELRANLRVYDGKLGIGNNSKLAGQFYSDKEVWLGNNTSFEYIATNVVPEPATVAMLALGGMVLLRKKKSKRQRAATVMERLP